MIRTVLLSAAIFVAASAAFAEQAIAQEAIATRPAENTAPQPQAEPVQSLEQPVSASRADAARWGHEILARANGQLPPSSDKDDIVPGQQAQAKGCVRNPDRSVHGSGGVAVGTGGYRHADIYATAPVGDCGQVSVGISKTEGGRRYYGGGPYGYGGYGGGYGAFDGY